MMYMMSMSAMTVMMRMMIMVITVGDVASALFRNGAHCLSRHCIIVTSAASNVHLYGSRLGRGC